MKVDVYPLRLRVLTPSGCLAISMDVLDFIPPRDVPMTWTGREDPLPSTVVNRNQFKSYRDSDLYYMQIRSLVSTSLATFTSTSYTGLVP